MEPRSEKLQRVLAPQHSSAVVDGLMQCYRGIVEEMVVYKHSIHPYFQELSLNILT
jgi:hypothetical protein